MVGCTDPASAVYAPGSPIPGSREDCSVCYDTKTCNLIFFGGWRMGWLDDLWCLNVAGVVGVLADDLRASGTWHEAYSAENGSALAAPGFLSWNTLAADLIPNLRAGIDPFELR